MRINGHPFLLLVSLLAAGSTVAAVVFWPRFAKAGTRAIAARVGLLAANQFLVILAIAAWFNWANSFYTSWSDLFGTDNRAPVTVMHGQQTGGLTPGQLVGRRRDAGVPADPAGTGKTLPVTIHGQASGIDAPGYVHLPPDYDQRAAQRFPVVMVLTATAADTTAVIRQVQGANGQRPLIYVIIRSSAGQPHNVQCVDVPGGPQAQTFFAKDVPAAITTVYHAASGSTGWAVIGNGSGGYCAAQLALTNPARFGAAASLAGYYAARQDGRTSDLFDGSSAIQNEADLVWRLQHMPQPPVSLVVAAEPGNATSATQTQHFAGLAKPPLSVSVMSIPSTTMNVWSAPFTQAIGILTQHVQPQTIS